MTMKYRHEAKFYINTADYSLLHNRLSHVMKKDSHAGPDGKYLIRSIYFDTPDDKALFEKITGTDNREKFRIRFYDHDDSFIKLEKKIKSNGLSAKFSASLTREQCLQILDANIEWLKSSDEPLLKELYQKMQHQQLKPKTIVDYLREAYVYTAGNVRVTIDRSIKTGLYGRDIFNKDIPTIETLDGRTAILEVKYDEFLPEVINDIIQLGERRRLSVSKYALSRIYG